MLCCFWSEAAVATLRFKSFVQAALSSKVNAESVESLLKQTKMLDEREPASPPSELVHMWPEGNEVHSSPLLWPASPYAAQLIGIKSFVAGMRSEQWRSSVYERAVVDMMAYGVEMDMVQLWEPEGPSVGDTITRHKLVRRRISREGNTWQSGLDALMRLPWASELCTETSGAPEAVSWAEVLCLKHLPSQLREAPWAAGVKEVLDAMGGDRAQDGERCGRAGERVFGGERGRAGGAGFFFLGWGQPLDPPALGTPLLACAHAPLEPPVGHCPFGAQPPAKTSPRWSLRCCGPVWPTCLCLTRPMRATGCTRSRPARCTTSIGRG